MVTQFLPAILIGGALGMLAAVDIFNEDGTAETANSGHFSDNLRGILHVMKSETAHHNVKLFLFEGEVLHIPDSKRYVRDSSRLRTFRADCQHRGRQINTNHFPRSARKCFRDAPRPSRDIQPPPPAFQPSPPAHPPN